MGQLSSTKLGFYNNGDWRFALDNAGNVGIGTTSPVYRLHIKDGPGGAQLKFERGSGIVGFSQDNNTSNLYLDASDGIFLNPGSWGMVGINTIYPQRQLHVMGDAQFESHSDFDGEAVVQLAKVSEPISGDAIGVDAKSYTVDEGGDPGPFMARRHQPLRTEFTATLLEYMGLPKLPLQKRVVFPGPGSSLAT